MAVWAGLVPCTGKRRSCFGKKAAAQFQKTENPPRTFQQSKQACERRLER